MTFRLTDAVLRRLLAQHRFALAPADGVVLFGLRGALPVDALDWLPGSEKLLAPASVDYRHLRCTLGVWNRAEGSLSACPGSTVPAQRFVTASAGRAGKGTNLLAEGLLAVTRGEHRGGKPANHHAAFRQAMPFPHRRTSDDAIYEVEDALSVGWPGDNIHAAYCEGLTREFASSQGCQVVSGFPHRPLLPGSQDSGAWQQFRDRAYDSGQARFRYLLLAGGAAAAAALSDSGTLPVTLRYGSSGDLVEVLQRKLRYSGFLEGPVDGAFGGETLLGLVALQRDLGLAPDGVCGIATAEALGLAAGWPRA